MSFLSDLLFKTSVPSTLIFIALAAVIGMLIGKIEFKNIKLGVAGVLFSGIAISHFGLAIDHTIVHFIREFGLILFVYAIGIDIGPKFINSLRNDGLILNTYALAIVLLGFVTALCIHYFANIPTEIICGIMSGAVTNTPGLGATQQVLNELGKQSEVAMSGMGYAIAYPFGIIGIILTMIIIRLIFKIKINREIDNYNETLGESNKKLESIAITITNPNIFNKSIKETQLILNDELVLSRIEREGEFIVASDSELLKSGDIVYGVSSEEFFDSIRMKLGAITMIDKKRIEGDLAMFHVLVTNRKYSGKTIEQIGIYRRYEANITRIFRSGIEILPTLNTIVEIGDTVRIVGKRELLDDIKKELGNSVKELAHPNVIPLFIGIVLGIIAGSIPIYISGLPFPAKLGLAGGPLLIAIFFGHKGRIGEFDFYMTPGANLFLKELGIVLFLAAVGLLSGEKFFHTLINGGYWWFLYGMLITFVPIFIVGVVARFFKLNYLKICGVVSGAMTDPPALEFANSIAPTQAQSTAYATVYPLTMFLRILIAQLLIFLTI